MLRVDRFFLSILVIKILLLIIFSSDYVIQFFIPFVEHFLHCGGNPWQHFYELGSSVEFPYNPLMLYIVSVFSAPAFYLGATSLILKNLCLKLPILLADLGIFFLLQRMFPFKRRALLFFVAASPIVLYSSYVHSQLDLIPTCMLLLAVYLLRKGLLLPSGLALGAAIGTKFHVVAALPLIVIFILKNYSFRRAITYAGLTLATYLFIVLPYFFSDGFFNMVLRHPKQLMIFNVSAYIGDLALIIPIFVLLLFYGRFIAYRKINNDLLDAFLGMTFASFVFFLIPAPAWYVWMFPFIGMLFIRLYQENNYLIYVYALLSCAYLLFFIFFYHEQGIHEVLLLGVPVDLKIYHFKLQSLAFTFLQAALFLVIYFMYKAGIRSNSIYQRACNMVIGIGGDSGTGKSTLMRNLTAILGGKVTVIEGDGDHRWERGNVHWQEFTHLNPKANFLHRQADHLLMLKMGKTAWRSDYNHHTGKFDAPLPVKPNEFILLSGLHPFYLPIMRKVIDLKIYLDPQELLKHHWKITRDVRERGYSKERILAQIDKRSEDLKKHIVPQRDFADLIIHFFTDTPFEAGGQNEAPELHLKLVLDSSIKIEPLVDALLGAGEGIDWNYAENLKTQELILYQPLKKQNLERLVRICLINQEEITGLHPQWLDGYDGFIQLVILLMISEKMREPVVPA